MSGFLTWIQSAIYNLVVPLLPNSLQELLLFIVTVVLVIIIIDLFVYTNIQRRIKNDSRCYQENKNNLASADYTVYVKTANGNNILAKITYDKNTKQTVWEDLCGPARSRTSTSNGTSSIGTPKEISYYIYIPNSPKPVNQIKRTINCPTAYDVTNVIYTGNYPPFTRFTQYGGSTDFFKTL